MGLRYKKFRAALAVAILRRASAIVLPAEFVQKVAQLGRQLGAFGTQILLQPFTHGIADRPAGLAVHLLAAFGLIANHGGFRGARLLK
jgi:hypothetical protein